MIILLDLNHTLVANSPARGSTPPRMVQRLAGELYREWLIDLVRPHHVILTTARPERWMEATLARIQEVTGWQPDDAHFAPPGWRNPAAIKRYLLMERIFPRHGREAECLAIGSNPHSRSMYGRLGIRCLWVGECGESLRDGLGVVIGLG